jgi:hypothetical protein
MFWTSIYWTNKYWIPEFNSPDWVASLLPQTLVTYPPEAATPAFVNYNAWVNSINISFEWHAVTTVNNITLLKQSLVLSTKEEWIRIDYTRIDQWISLLITPKEPTISWTWEVYLSFLSLSINQPSAISKIESFINAWVQSLLISSSEAVAQSYLAIRLDTLPLNISSLQVDIDSFSSINVWVINILTSVLSSWVSISVNWRPDSNTLTLNILTPSNYVFYPERIKPSIVWLRSDKVLWTIQNEKINIIK